MALTIVKHHRWKDAMHHPDPTAVTPMNLMIQYLPQVALVVLDVSHGFCSSIKSNLLAIF